MCGTLDNCHQRIRFRVRYSQQFSSSCSLLLLLVLLLLTLNVSETRAEGVLLGSSQSRLTFTPSLSVNWTVLNHQTPDLTVPTHLLALNITHQVGDTAYLTCHPPANSTSPVWIRRSDYYIISGGTSRYVADNRFHVLPTNNNTQWTLQIKFLRSADRGVYECQVADGHEPWSHFVRLLVLQPIAQIVENDDINSTNVGVGDYHVQLGNNVQLICVIRGGVRPPSYVFWYHDQSVIKSGHPSDRVHVVTGSRSHERSEEVTNDSHPLTTSRLTLSSVQSTDSGNYSCRPPHTIPASVIVFVSQGDNTAAIQRIGNSVSRRVLSVHTVCTVVLLFVLPRYR